MLETTSRRLLFDALRPPPGYTMDRAIGTTFSLDLFALLTAPLAFTFFEWAEEGGPQQAHPLALLEALRRYAGRISLFCQAGQIAIPKTQRLLYGYLEESVVEVTAPHEAGVFHPKIWLLRYVASGSVPHYRLLCLSRNLTFDRSWDTALVLDGQFFPSPDSEQREQFHRRNQPLREFLAALPALATRTPAERIQQDIAQLCQDLDHVDFVPPEGFSDLTFWPLGIREKMPLPFDVRMDQLLIIAPFLHDRLLKYLTDRAKTSVLVSRAEELAKCSRANLEHFEEVYALSPDADIEVSEATGQNILSGLHAKVYVADDGWNAHLWTGSANATVAAFTQNVEFLIELQGKKSRCGVDQILGRNSGQNGLLSLLLPYEIPVSPRPEHPVEALLDRLTHQLCNALAKARLIADVVTAQEEDSTPAYRITLLSADDGEQQQEALRRLADAYEALQQTTVESFVCWPVSRTDRDAVAFTIDGVQGAATPTYATFDPLSAEALTSFFAFRLTLRVDRPQRTFRRTCSFVLNLPLRNAPPDRQQRLLRSLLVNRQEVLRFLRLLLAGEGADVSHLLEMSVRENDPESVTDSAAAGFPLEFPLLEALIRALHEAPEKLDDVQRLVTDLAGGPGGVELLPEGFEAIWEPIRAMREELARREASGTKPSKKVTRT